MINTSIDIGIALGYAIYPKDGESFEELYKKADLFMYSNKPKESSRL